MNEKNYLVNDSSWLFQRFFVRRSSICRPTCCRHTFSVANWPTIVRSHFSVSYLRPASWQKEYSVHMIKLAWRAHIKHTSSCLIAWCVLDECSTTSFIVYCKRDASLAAVWLNVWLTYIVLAVISVATANKYKIRLYSTRSDHLPRYSEQWPGRSRKGAATWLEVARRAVSS